MHLCLEETVTSSRPYRNHLHSSGDLVTTYEAIRAGFVELALEKAYRASPLVEEARRLYEAASRATTPAGLRQIEGIQSDLLAAAGLSDKAIAHLRPKDKEKAIANLIKNFLEPAGDKFVEELVYRFLLTRGDTLGGEMRNIGGVLAQRKLTRAITSTLKAARIQYRWQHAETRQWVDKSNDDLGTESCLRGLSWKKGSEGRTLIYNLYVPLVQSNVDICLFNLNPEGLEPTNYKSAQSYVALGELKGGIDPAGADERWKTAQAALDRIRKAFVKAKHSPHLFFIAAAIEKRMAEEIWDQLEKGLLTNAANLNHPKQMASICRWLCML
jgi:hypothetical protein